MAELERLYVRVLGDIQDFEKKMSKAERVTEQLAYDMQQVGKKLTLGVTAPLAAIGGLAVSAAADMDRLRRGLETSAGSSAAAARQLSELEKIARLPGLGFREAIQGAVQLNTALAELPDTLQYSNRLLMQFGNAIALTGGGKAELDRVITQLGQIAAAGKVLTQDLRPIIQTAPAVANALRAAFGTISPQEINDLGLSSQEFFDRLLGGLEGLDRASGGVANTFENFTDALFRARVAIGDQLLPVVTPLVERVAQLLEETSGANAATIQWGIALAGAAAIMGPLLITVGTLTKAFVALRVAGLAALPLMGVGGLLALGIGALTALFIKGKLEAAEYASELNEMRDSAASLTDKIKELTAAETLRALAGRRMAIERLQQRREELLEEARRRAAGTGQFGVGAVADDRTLRSFLSREQKASLDAVDRALAATEGTIAGLEQQYIQPATAAKSTSDTLGGSTRITADAFRALRDPLGQINAELDRLRDREQKIMLEQALGPAADRAEKLAEELAEVRRQLRGLENVRLDFLPTKLADSIRQTEGGLPHGRIWTDEDLRNAGRESGKVMADAFVLHLGQTIGGQPGRLFGAIGGGIESGRLFGGNVFPKVGDKWTGNPKDLISSDPLAAAMGAVGAIGALAAGASALNAIFGQTESAVERANTAFTRMADALNLRFAVLDIEDSREQFNQLLAGFMEQFAGTTTAAMLEGLSFDTFDEMAPGLVQWLETIKALPGVQAIEGPFEALLRELDRLSDSLGEASRILNAPSGFKVGLARFNAAQAADVSGMRGSLPTRPGAGINIGTVVIEAADDPRQAWENFRRGLEDARVSGDPVASGISLSGPV